MPYPIFVNLDGRRCVVVGGGKVAERRLHGLLDHGGAVEIVAPKITEGIAELCAGEGLVAWTSAAFYPAALDGAFLAVAATDDPAVNASVAEAARERSILVCRADSPNGGDFVTPAVLERGALTIALSTGGASPTLASVAIEKMEAAFGPEWAGITALFAQLRPAIQAKQPEAARRALVETILSDQLLMDNLRAGRFDEALSEASRCI